MRIKSRRARATAPGPYTPSAAATARAPVALQARLGLVPFDKLSHRKIREEGTFAMVEGIFAMVETSRAAGGDQYCPEG